MSGHGATGFEVGQRVRHHYLHGVTGKVISAEKEGKVGVQYDGSCWVVYRSPQNFIPITEPAAKAYQRSLKRIADGEEREQKLKEGRIALTDTGSRVFSEALLSPPEPNKNLRSLASEQQVDCKTHEKESEAIREAYDVWEGPARYMAEALEEAGKYQLAHNVRRQVFAVGKLLDEMREG